MSVKISELPILDSLADNDVIAGVDTSANVTSKIEMATLKNYIDTNTQYTAGTNIDITNNVISAPFVYDMTQTNALLDDWIDTIATSFENLEEETNAQIEELQSEVDSLSTIYNAFPTESGEGESLTLDDTAEVKFKKFDLKGNTSQTTYSGKNLLPNNGTTLTRNGMTFTVNDDGSYTLNGTTTSATDYNICQAGELQLEAGTYTLSSTTNIPSGMWLSVYEGTSDKWAMTGTNTKTMTVSTATTNAKGHFYINNGVTLNNLRIYPMIVSGTTVGDYEPYTGKTASPNPSYPQPVNVVSGDNEINVCGKNLFNKDSVSIGYLKEDGTLSTDTAYRTSAFMPIRPNTTYYKTSTGSPRTKYFDINKVPLNTTTYWDVPTGGSAGTFTTPNNAYYLRFSFPFTGSSAIDASTIMVKEGTDTTYEPYQGNTYDIDLPVENLFNSNLKQGGRYFNNGNFFTADNYVHNENPISVVPGETYTLSATNYSAKSEAGFVFFNNGTYVSGSKQSSQTFTVPSNANQVYCDFYTGSNVTPSDITNIQLEKGSKANSYTPYGTTPIELCKIGNYQDYFAKSDGRNLFIPTLKVDNTDISVTRCTVSLSGDEYTFTATSNDMYFGNIVASGTSYQNIFGTLYDVEGITNLVFKPTNSDFDKNFVCYYDKNKVSLGYEQINNSTGLITPVANTKYVGFRIGKNASVSGTSYSTKFQLEVGSSATPWQPYGVGKWYLHKEIGKVVLNGSENWIIGNTGTANWFYRLNSFYYGLVDLANAGICTNYSCVDINNNNTTQGISASAVGHNIFIRYGTEDTIENWKAWLSTHNVVVYYVLATPTNTEVTYEPLIDQLNLLEKAISYDSQTNISQVNNDLGFIIYAEAIKSLENVLDRLALVEE